MFIIVNNKFFTIFTICIATSFLKISNTTAYITTLTNITVIVVIHILFKNIFIIHADIIIHKQPTNIPANTFFKMCIRDRSGTRLCNVYGGYRWVAIPDYDMVNNAIEMINKIKSGEIFDVSEYIK